MPLSPFQIVKSSPGINAPLLDAALINDEQQQITSSKESRHPVGAGEEFLYIAKHGVSGKTSCRDMDKCNSRQSGGPFRSYLKCDMLMYLKYPDDRRNILSSRVAPRAKHTMNALALFVELSGQPSKGLRVPYQESESELG